MSGRSTRRLAASSLLVTGALLGGCSSSAPSVDDHTVSNATAQASDELAAACTDTIDDVYRAPDNTPSPSMRSTRAAIVRCAKDRTFTAEQLDAAVRANGYAGPALPSGGQAYRVTYRTHRVGNDEGLTSALVLVPQVPVAARHPLVVVGHGSVGVAETCAPSRGDLLSVGSFLDDAHSLALPLVGYGYTVIMPDYAGYGFGKTPGWLLAEDEAHSLLDATFAMRNLLKPGSLTDDNVMIGHSQGGHAVLSAQAYARTYGVAGRLSGVVAEAPLWIAARSWGAALSDPTGLGLGPKVSTSALTYAVQYFYTHGEIYDGPGHGLDPMTPDVRAALGQALTTSCLDTIESKVTALGTTAASLFRTSFQLEVASCADTGVCLGSTASTWWDRFHADRPAIDPAGAPIVLIAGGSDQTVTAAYSQCGIDRIKEDVGDAPQSVATFCIDQDATHGAVVHGDGAEKNAITRRSADWINHWIAARTLGAPEPYACTPWTGTDVDGGAVSCPSLPSNSD